MKLLSLLTLLLTSHVFLDSLLAKDTLEIKSQWLDKKTVKLEKIIEITEEEYKLGRVSLNTLISWNKSLFQTKEKKLQLTQNSLRKEEYQLKLLEHSIEKVSFYNNKADNVKMLIEVGMFYEVDLLSFEINALEAYSNYQATLAEYKSLYPNQKLTLKLPNNLEIKLKNINKGK